MMASKSGLRSVPSTPGSVAAQRRHWRRGWEVDLVLVSVEVQEELFHSLTTSAILASGRSTLLTTSTTGRRAARALRSTKRVWGSGLGGVDEQEDPSTMVSPARPRAEVGVARGVDDVELHTAVAHGVFLARS